MFVVGEASILAKRLAQITYECMWLGIQQVRNGARLGDIGHAIQQHAEGAGYSVVREYCGHGIGKVFHRTRRSCTTAAPPAWRSRPA
jgi:methionyl aminopeptidase